MCLNLDCSNNNNGFNQVETLLWHQQTTSEITTKNIHAINTYYFTTAALRAGMMIHLMVQICVNTADLNHHQISKMYTSGIRQITHHWAMFDGSYL